MHRLRANGLINRHAHAQAPPCVEYRLTSLGQSLVDGPMKALGRWTIEHGAKLLDAQERAGDRTPREPQR
jgi:DNA-binding HxlR family transcriptional regulator